jgi:ABC-type multidrug transport system ATPase subunit
VEAHFPHLTVGQTLDFAVDSRTPAAQRASKIKDEYVYENTDMLATTFGLRHALQTSMFPIDTLYDVYLIEANYLLEVGSDFVRGVSGGERKRVSLAEVVS